MAALMAPIHVMNRLIRILERTGAVVLLRIQADIIRHRRILISCDARATSRAAIVDRNRLLIGHSSAQMREPRPADRRVDTLPGRLDVANSHPVQSPWHLHDDRAVAVGKYTRRRGVAPEVGRGRLWP